MSFVKCYINYYIIILVSIVTRRLEWNGRLKTLSDLFSFIKIPNKKLWEIVIKTKTIFMYDK